MKLLFINSVLTSPLLPLHCGEGKCVVSVETFPKCLRAMASQKGDK